MSSDIRRDRLIICAIFASACVIYLIVISFLGIETEVTKNHFKFADDVFTGEAFKTEYPPLMLIFLLIPRFFSSHVYGYTAGFVAEMFVFFVIGLFVICKLAERLGKNQRTYMLAYTVLMFITFGFVVDRMDIIPAVITLAAIYCYITKRYTLAFVLLSAGTMIKLYPAVLFPVFLIPFIMNREWRNALKGMGAFVTASLAVVIPLMLLQYDMSYFIEYHSDRNLQVESVAAAILFPLSMLGLIETYTEFGPHLSDDLRGTWPDAVATLLTPLMIVSILIVYAVCIYMFKKIKSEDGRLYLFANALLLSVMMFIMVGKVFSGQYIIWVIPLLLFVFMVSLDKEWNRKMFILMVVIIATIQIQFGYVSGYLGGADNIDTLGIMLIIAKNAMMVIMLYCVLKALYRRYRSLTVRIS